MQMGNFPSKNFFFSKGKSSHAEEFHNRLEWKTSLKLHSLESFKCQLEWLISKTSLNLEIRNDSSLRSINDPSHLISFTFLCFVMACDIRTRSHFEPPANPFSLSTQLQLHLIAMSHHKLCSVGAANLRSCHNKCKMTKTCLGVCSGEKL